MRKRLEHTLQLHAFLREAHAFAFKRYKLRAIMPLQSGHMLGHRRLGEIQLASRMGIVQQTAYGQKRLHAKIKHRASPSFVFAALAAPIVAKQAACPDRYGITIS